MAPHPSHNRLTGIPSTLSHVVFAAALGAGILFTSSGLWADNDATAALSRINTWLGGAYSNGAQVADDVTRELPERLRHTPLHQIVAPAQLSGFDGLTFFVQTSSDGTGDTIVGTGIYHFYSSPEGDAVIMRLRQFKDRQAYIGAASELSRLADVTLEDLTWNDGCEFYLNLSEDQTAVLGSMREGACKLKNRQTGDDLLHMDDMTLTENELWFNGKFYDADGNFLFGNASDERIKMKRIGDAS